MDFKITSVVCLLYSCIEIVDCACFGYARHAWHPRTTRNRFYRHMKASMGHCGVSYMPGEPKTRTIYKFDTNVYRTYNTFNLEIHFPISNLDARKKLSIWAYAQFQGASVCCPQILPNVNICTWKIRYPVIFHHIPAISTLFEYVRLIAVCSCSKPKW